MKITPPAVMIGPPSPPVPSSRFGTIAGARSCMEPTLRVQLMLPERMSTDASTPQGGAVQGMPSGEPSSVRRMP